MYSGLIESIDAMDNGISQYPEGVFPMFRNNSSIQNKIGRMNPRWNEEETNTAIDQRFHNAMQFAEDELVMQVIDIVMYYFYLSHFSKKYNLIVFFNQLIRS